MRNNHQKSPGITPNFFFRQVLGIAALVFQIHYRDDVIKGICDVMVRVCGVERVMVIAASL